MNGPDREGFKQAVRAAACDEDGARVLRGMDAFTWIDWAEDDVLHVIDRADDVLWIDSIFDHDLAVRVDGTVWRFQVKSPGKTAFDDSVPGGGS